MMPSLRVCLAATLLPLILSACGSPPHNAPQPPRNTMNVIAPADYSEHSYRGKPDLGLTLAIVEAGGGAKHFESGRLFQTLAGHNAKAEAAKLEQLYGKARMAAFMQTFTYSMRDLVALFKLNGIHLPDRPRISPSNGRDLTVAIYHAGVMPTGRYDCGYMMEHLMTHPIHIVLMHDINVARGHGPVHNANFHIILTRMVADLRDLYTRNGRTSAYLSRINTG